MSESGLCKILLDTLRDHQNALQPERTNVHRANAYIQQTMQEISFLNNQLQIVRTSGIGLGSSGKIFGRRGGSATSVLGKTEIAIKISRIEGQIRIEQRHLDRAKIELREAENNVEFYEQVSKGRVAKCCEMDATRNDKYFV